MFHYEPLKDVKRSIIVDTDIGPDVDDVGALVVLFKLAEKYSVPVLGVVNCTSNEYGNGAIDVVSRYCGAKNIRIGQTAKPEFLDDETTRYYNKYLTEYFGSDYGPGKKRPEEAVSMYRRLLSAAKDGSVIIVTIGPLNNLGGLLTSGPDEISSKDGRTLVAEKVHAVVTMGGSTEIHRREYNIVCDGEASTVFLRSCPVPVILSGVELGERIKVPFRKVPENAEENPVYQAYRLLSVYFKTSVCQSAGFDLTAVQFAFEGEGEYYTLRGPGKMLVFPEEDYATEFVLDESGTHYSMEPQISHEELGRVFEDFICRANQNWSPAKK